MTEQQLSELEKQLGRELTPDEKRLLRYTDGELPQGPEKKSSPPREKELPTLPARRSKIPKRKKADQSGMTAD